MPKLLDKMWEGAVRYGTLENATSYYSNFHQSILDIRSKIQRLKDAIETSLNADGITRSEYSRLMNEMTDL